MWTLFVTAMARPPMVPTMHPDEIVAYHTPDGWTGQLRHYQADGPPVMLIHNMGVNHLNWDFDPQISLAHALVEANWDVWVVVLPGDEGTTPPSAIDDQVDFTQLVEVHLPAITQEVLDQTDHQAVYMVGHSMGGILLYASIGELPIAAGVSISGNTQFRYHPPLLGLAGGIYKRTNTHDLSRRFLWTYPFNPIVSMFGRRRHLDRTLTRGVLSYAVDDSPRGVTTEVIDWMIRGTPLISQRDGQPMVDFDTSVPLLALHGTRDRLVGVNDGERSCASFRHCTFVPLQGYGHLDTVLGSTARDEVYPLVIRWLDEQRRARERAGPTREVLATDEASRR